MCIIICILYITIYGNQEIEFVRQKCLTLSIINNILRQYYVESYNRIHGYLKHNSMTMAMYL